MGLFDRLRNIPPWRKTYKSLLDRYAFLSGVYGQYAKRTNTEYTPIGPLTKLLQEQYPGRSEKTMENLVLEWKKQFDGSKFLEFMTGISLEMGIHKGAIQGKEAAKIVLSIMLKPEHYNAFFVKYVIGQIIEEELGLEQKRLY
jgi:hypothetical protein